MFQLLMGQVQILHAKIDVGVVLFASVSGSVIRPWHNAKAE